MKSLYMLSFLFFTGCIVKSVAPSSGGLEVDFDISKSQFRHGWAYLSKPLASEEYVRNEDSIKRGKQLYLQHCEKCHGLKGKGDGGLAKALKLKPANLSQLPSDLSKTYLLVQIQDGKGSMPAWRNMLPDSQVVDLTNYLRELSRKPKK